jgi:hypothetical protein
MYAWEIRKKIFNVVCGISHSFSTLKGLFEEISGEYYLGYLFVEMVGGSDRLIKNYS